MKLADVLRREELRTFSIMNATQQKACDIANGIIDACLSRLAVLLIIFALLTWAQNHWWPKTDSTDKDAWTRSNMTLCVDYGTGLHYLFKDGVLIPRLDAEGKQVREP